MAVVTKYVVVRNGVELDKEFLVKKEAEAYDKMLDAAENLAAFIRDGDLDIELAESTVEAVSVFLAKNGPEVVRILKGIKPMAAPTQKPQGKSGETPERVAKKKAPAAKTGPKGK
jgi:dsDNA-binding SOS-regulon protein